MYKDFPFNYETIIASLQWIILENNNIICLQSKENEFKAMTVLEAIIQQWTT